MNMKLNCLCAVHQPGLSISMNLRTPGRRAKSKKTETERGRKRARWWQAPMEGIRWEGEERG